jgi:hypothetical protein
MGAPIIFIHYGNSSFLPFVIKIAKRFNPNKEIIFLGDKDNDYLQELDIFHYYFEEFSYGPEIEIFDRRYPYIENKRYAKKAWAKFILRRWFIINNFIKQKKISQFWTFDSDNFLLTDLEPYENKFALYDCTSQCNGICLNGFVPSKEVVQNYINKINELLLREGYTDIWQERYRQKPDLFYTEMEAFSVFVKEEAIRNFHISRIYEDAAFEDSITYVKDGMEMYEKQIKNRYIKKLYLKNGGIYCKHLSSGKFIKMNNLNLSWMPKYVFPLLYSNIMSDRSEIDFVPINLLKAPLSYHVKFFIKTLIPPKVRDKISRGSYWV